METVVVCLTPPGKAAIATVGVRGASAWQITRQLFEPRRGALPDEPSAGKHWFGRLGVDARDDVILAVKQGMPCPSLEVHCHGGVAVVRMIEGLYEEHGARKVSWAEFLRVPGPPENGEDGWQAKILCLLAHAPTTRTAAILLDQWHRAWKPLSECGPDALRRLQDLIPLGRHLVEPWKVVIAGQPNVGKSSLMNALAGYARSVVSPVPGTTRDLVTTRLAIDGWPVEMTDTAGLHRAGGDLERQGIERARTAVAEADLRLWVIDGAGDRVLPDDPAEWCFVVNKSDLPAAWDWHAPPEAHRISARTGAGLPELCDLISRRLVPQPPAPGEAVPCLPEQIQWIRQAVPAQEQAHGLVGRQGV